MTGIKITATPDRDHQMAEGEDLIFTITVKLRAESYRGIGPRPRPRPAPKVCENCDGSGDVPTGVEHFGCSEYVECYVCLGWGMDPRGRVLQLLTEAARDSSEPWRHSEVTDAAHQAVRTACADVLRCYEPMLPYHPGVDSDRVTTTCRGRVMTIRFAPHVASWLSGR